VVGTKFNSDTELYDLIRDYNSDDLHKILCRVDSLTVLNTYKCCDNNTRKILLPYISEYETEDFISHLDRLEKHIPIEDCIKAKNIVCDIARKYNSDKNNFDIKEIPFTQNRLAGYRLYEIIPKNISLDYNSFINAYYEIIWLLYMCYNTTMKCGLLEMANIPYYLKDTDNIFVWITLIIDGVSREELYPVMFKYIEKENNIYKKKLKQVAANGILEFANAEIHRYNSSDEFIMSLIDNSGIHDDITLNASKEYKNGNAKAFSDLFKKGSLLYNKMNQATIEREEIIFVRKVMNYIDKIRMEGLESLEDILDKELIFKNDLFEYGISILIGGTDAVTLKTTLKRKLEEKADIIIDRNFYLAQIDAVLSIQREDMRTILFELILSHFEDDISDTIRETLLRDYFER
jgi:flagellar motor component MotA